MSFIDRTVDTGLWMNVIAFALLAILIVTEPMSANVLGVSSTRSETVCRTTIELPARLMRIRGTTASIRKQDLPGLGDGDIAFFRARRELPLVAANKCRSDRICFKITPEDRRDRITAYTLERTVRASRLIYQVQASEGRSSYLLPAQDEAAPATSA